MGDDNLYESIDPDAWRQRIYAMLEGEKMIVVNGKWRVPERVGSDEQVQT